MLVIKCDDNQLFIAEHAMKAVGNNFHGSLVEVKRIDALNNLYA